MNFFRNLYIKKREMFPQSPNNHTDYFDYHNQNSYHVIYRKIRWNTLFIRPEWSKILSQELNRIDPKITGKSKRQQVVLSLSYRAAVVAPVRAIQRGWKECQICRKCREDLGEIAVLSVRWSCGGSGTELWWWDAGSGWTVGVKSEDWKIEESEINVVKSGLWWIGQVSRMRGAWLVPDWRDWQTLNIWANIHMYSSTEYEYDNQYFELSL